MLGLGLALTNFGTKGGISDIADGGLLSSTFLSRYGPYGMVMDFTDASITIDDSTDVLDYSSQGTVSSTTGALLGPGSKLTYTAPSVKLTEQADGYLAFQAHNLCLQSETFDNASWTKTRSSVTADAIAAPNGATTADKLLDSVTSGTHIVSQTTTNGSFQYTSSVWVKAAELSFASLEMSDNSTGSVVAKFNLATGALDGSITTGGSWTSSSATITAEANGWYKLTLTSTRGAGTQTVQNIGCYKTANTVSYAGTGTDGVYIFGAQLRRTPSVSTYVATTSAAVYDLPYVYSAGVKTGVMVEPAATNLALRSNEFDNASWTKSNFTVSANAVTAPDGTVTADQLTATSGGNQLFQLPTLSDSTSYTGSFYVKKVSGDWVYILQRDKAGVSHTAWFNLATGAKGTTTGTVSAYTITAVNPSGWYRITATSSSGAGGTAPLFFFGTATADGATSGTTGDSVYIWGAQLESGTVATSPIITYGSSVVRAADEISIATSLFPYVDTAWTIFAQYAVPVGGSRGVWGLGLNGSNYAFANSQNRALFVVTSSATVADLSPNTGYPGNVVAKIASAAAANDFAASYNGGAVSTDTSGAMPTAATLLRVGREYSSTFALNGLLLSLAVFPERKANATLQTMTTA